MATFQRILETSIPPDPEKLFRARQKLISEIELVTGRKLIIYAADFNKGNPATPNSINASDKIGFSDILEDVEGKPVDILLHSPGGVVDAAEIIVNMIRETCKEVRYIVPHSAKSAATLMTLSGDSILMDHRSELGPIDPQVLVPLHNGASMYVPAQTLIDGFKRARDVIQEKGPEAIPAFLPLLSKYDLHMLEICENAKSQSQQLAKTWLNQYMFQKDSQGAEKAEHISTVLANHNEFKSHGRPIKLQDAKTLGLVIEDLRRHTKLQSMIWNLFCNIDHFFSISAAVKVFENGKGVSWSRNLSQQHIMLPIPQLVPPPTDVPEKAPKN